MSETKSNKRWASRAIVNMLVHDMKDYKAAAEVVSGAEDVFVLHAKDIGDMIARIQERPSEATAKELKERLEKAREDITLHRDWEREVLDSLPRVDDEEGLTGPLRQAFAKTAKARVKLHTQVMEATDKWLAAQAETFKLDS